MSLSTETAPAVVESLENKYRALLAMSLEASKMALNGNGHDSRRIAEWTEQRRIAFEIALARTYSMDSPSNHVHLFLRATERVETINTSRAMSGPSMECASCPICQEFLVWESDTDTIGVVAAACCGFDYRARPLAFSVTRELAAAGGTATRLWKNNRVDKFWELTAEEIARRFWEWKDGREAVNLERELRWFITANESIGGLESLFEEEDYPEVHKATLAAWPKQAVAK